jgi:hypothetical protein
MNVDHGTADSGDGSCRKEDLSQGTVRMPLAYIFLPGRELLRARSIDLLLGQCPFPKQLIHWRKLR